MKCQVWQRCPHSQQPVLFQVAVPYHPDSSLVPFILLYQKCKGHHVILRTWTLIVLTFLNEYRVIPADIGPIVYANEEGVVRVLVSCSKQCPRVVMMPHIFHPMVLEPQIFRHTLLVSPSHCDAFTDVIRISHRLSRKGLAWNRVRYKKQYPKRGGTKGQGSVGRSGNADAAWIVWSMSHEESM